MDPFVTCSVMMLFAAYNYLTNVQIKGAFVHLSFPSYFRIELGIAKALGAIALLLTLTPNRLKEFAYFGFAITFISAFIAHISSGDPMSVAIAPVVFLGILTISYIYFHNSKRIQTKAEVKTKARQIEEPELEESYVSK
jgi:hypothetical protein